MLTLQIWATKEFVASGIWRVFCAQSHNLERKRSGCLAAGIRSSSLDIKTMTLLYFQALYNCKYSFFTKYNTLARTHSISGRKSWVWHWQFWNKYDGERWSRFFLFWNSASPVRVAAAQCKKICPERLNWPGRLAFNSEGASRISKKKTLDHFSPSFLTQKCWFQDLRF